MVPGVKDQRNLKERRAGLSMGGVIGLVESMSANDAKSFFESINEDNIDDYIAFLLGLKQHYATNEIPDRYIPVLLSTTIPLLPITFAFIVLLWPKYDTNLYHPLLKNFRICIKTEESAASLFLHGVFSFAETEHITQSCLEGSTLAIQEVCATQKYISTQYLHSILSMYIRKCLKGDPFLFRGFDIIVRSFPTRTVDLLPNLTILCVNEVMECTTTRCSVSKKTSYAKRIMSCLGQLYSTMDSAVVVQLVSECFIFAACISNIRAAALEYISTAAIENTHKVSVSYHVELLPVMEILLDIAMLDRADTVRRSALNQIQRLVQDQPGRRRDKGKNMRILHNGRQTTSRGGEGGGQCRYVVSSVRRGGGLVTSAVVQALLMKCRDKDQQVRNIAFGLLHDTIGIRDLLSVLTATQAEVFIGYAVKLFPPGRATVIAHRSQVDFVLELC